MSQNGCQAQTLCRIEHFVRACEQCRGRTFPNQSHLIRSMDNSMHGRSRSPAQFVPVTKATGSVEVHNYSQSALSLVKLRSVD